MKYFDETFKYFLNRFPESIILKIFYSIFLGDYLNRFDKSYIILSQLFTSSLNLTPSQEFFAYRLMRKIEEKSFEYGIDKTKVSLKYQCNKLIDLIAEISYTPTIPIAIAIVIMAIKLIENFLIIS